MSHPVTLGDILFGKKPSPAHLPPSKPAGTAHRGKMAPRKAKAHAKPSASARRAWMETSPALSISSEFASIADERQRIKMTADLHDMLKQKKKGKDAQQSAELKLKLSADLSAVKETVLRKVSSSGSSRELTRHASSSSNSTSSSKPDFTRSASSRNLKATSEFDLQHTVRTTSVMQASIKKEMQEIKTKADRVNGVLIAPDLSTLLPQRGQRSSTLSLLNPAPDIEPSLLDGAPMWARADGPRDHSPITGEASGALFFEMRPERQSNPRVTGSDDEPSSSRDPADDLASGRSSPPGAILSSPHNSTDVRSSPGGIRRLESLLSTNARQKVSRTKISAALNRPHPGVPLMVLERSTSLPDLRLALARSIEQTRRAERAQRAEGPGPAAQAVDKGFAGVFAMLAATLVAAAYSVAGVPVPPSPVPAPTEERESELSEGYYGADGEGLEGQGSPHTSDGGEEGSEWDGAAESQGRPGPFVRQSSSSAVTGLSFVKLCELKAIGMLSEEEFERLKQALLEEMYLA